MTEWATVVASEAVRSLAGGEDIAALLVVGEQASVGARVAVSVLEAGRSSLAAEAIVAVVAVEAWIVVVDDVHTAGGLGSAADADTSAASVAAAAARPRTQMAWHFLLHDHTVATVAEVEEADSAV